MALELLYYNLRPASAKNAHFFVKEIWVSTYTKTINNGSLMLVWIWSKKILIPTLHKGTLKLFDICNTDILAEFVKNFAYVILNSLGSKIDI